MKTRTYFSSHTTAKTNIFTLLVFCFLKLSLQAQEFKLNKLLSLQEVTGLENIKNPRGILQDHFGYIWIGTSSGLYKFDGYKIIHYSFDPNQPNKIAGDALGDIEEDNEGNIWFGVFGIGLQKFNPSTEQFVLYKADRSNPDALNDSRIHDLKFYNNKLWIGTWGGLSCFSNKTGKFKTFAKGYSTQRVIIDNEVIWMMKRRVLSYYDAKLDSLVPYDSLDIELPTGLKLAVNHKIYMSPGITSGRLYVYDIKSKKLECLERKREEDYIIDIIDLNQRQLLIARSNKKLEFYDTEKSTFYTSLTNSKIIQHNFANSSFYKLKNGDLWYLGDVIFNAISDEKGIASYEIIQNDTKINIEWSSLLSQWTPNSISIGTGLLLDFNNNNIIKTSSISPPLHKFELAYGLSGKVSVHKDENNVRWLAHQETDFPSFYISLYKLSNFDKKLQKLDVFRPGTLSGGLTKIGDELWISVWGGLTKWHIPTAKKTSYVSGKDSSQLSSTDLKFIFKDCDNDLWIATQNGLNLKKKNQDYFKHYLSHPGDTNALSFNSISTINQDSSGIIWIGTQGGGVNTFNKKTGLFSWITTNQGLANNKINNILVDDNQDVWVSHDLGISKINARSKAIHNFSQADGVISYIQENSSIKMADGSLIFGGTGFNRIFPNKIKSDNFQPPLLITHFKLFNKDVSINDADSILRQHINNTPSITLLHHQNVITLEYAALDMAHPAQMMYAYQLIGFDQNWQYVDNKREVTYTNLKPGNYTFKIKCTHNEGPWYELKQPLRIIILPPWWLTWWFKTISVVLMVSTIALFMYVWFNYKFRQKLKVELIRQKIAADLHDEIGSNLSSMAFSAELMKKKLGGSRNDIEYLLNKLVSNSKETTSLISDTIWSLNPKNDSFDKLKEHMNDFAQDILTSKEIDYEFNSTGQGLSPVLSIEQKRNIYLIYKEAINNIAKHSKASQVHIRIETLQDKLIIEIKDNGIGFDTTDTPPGNGLNNFKTRSEKDSTEVQYSSFIGNGTVVKIIANYNSANSKFHAK